MKTGHLNSRRVLAGVVALLLASSFMSSTSLWNRAIVNTPRRLLDAITNPVTQPMHALGSRLRGEGEDPIDLGNDPEVLTELLLIERSYNRRLEQQLVEARQVAADFQAIQGRLPQSGYAAVPARVTRWSPSVANPTLTIDKGERHGIRRGMVVAHKSYLVGRVTHTSYTNATVSLLNTPGATLAFLVLPRDARPDQPHPEWTMPVEVDQDGEVFHAVLGANENLEIGYLAHVHRSDPNWPEEAWGLIAGQLTAIEPYPDDPTSRQRLVFKPAVALRRLNRVTVITPVEASQGGQRSPKEAKGTTARAP